MQKLTLTPIEIMSLLPLTINIRFVSNLMRTQGTKQWHHDKATTGNYYGTAYYVLHFIIKLGLMIVQNWSKWIIQHNFNRMRADEY